MSVNKKLFEKGDYGVAGDTEARTHMKGANPDLMDQGDNGFQSLNYDDAPRSTPTAPVTVKDPTPKPKPKPKPVAEDPAPTEDPTPPTDAKPGLGAYLAAHWKEIAIVAGAAALIAALVALFKGASKSIKLRYNKAVKTLARMQKDFTMSEKGLDMRAVLPGVGSRLNDFFTRVLSGSAFNNNGRKGIMGRKSSRKYKDGVIGLYPFCGRLEEDIDNDFNMAKTVFSKIKLSADQQEANGDNTKHTDHEEPTNKEKRQERREEKKKAKENNNESFNESYGDIKVYNSFREAFNAGQLYESADGKPLNESFGILPLAMLASATIRGGMFIANKYKANKKGEMEKVEGGATAVQVTKESTREMCYAIMNAFFEKYISFEEVSKKMGVDIKGLSDIDNSTIDKFSQLLKAYSNPDGGAMTKQYSKIKTQYKKMCNHYFNIGTGVIANFKKYTKAEDEKHENLLTAANEKLSAMWDEQKDKYNDIFPYVLNEIITHSHYQDYIDFIIEDVIPVFRTGIAGDADYMLDVMPKKGDLFLLRQTAHGKQTINGQKVDVGNMAIVEITKTYSPEHKNLEMRFIGLYKSKTVDELYDGSVSLICHDSTVDRAAYSTKPVLITYQKFMALDPRIIANANDFIIAKPTAMPKRAAEKKQEYFIPNDVINSIPALKSMISNLATQISSISSRQDQMNGAIIRITDVLGKDGEKLKADIVALVTDKVQIEKKDTGDDTIVEPVKIEQPTPDPNDTEKPIIIIKNEINVTGDGEKKDEGEVVHSIEIPVAELKEAEPEIVPVEPVEETVQPQDKEETGNDYMNSHWIGKKDNLTLCVIPYAQENNVTKFAVRIQKDNEIKNLNVAINGDADWDKINTELDSQYGLKLNKNDVNNGRQIGIEKTIKHISTEELQTVNSTDEFIKFINDSVNGESSEETPDYHNSYWTWNKRDSEASSSLTMVLYQNKNNSEATRFACILTKNGEKKYFNIAVRDGVEWSAFNKELESIGMKRVDSAEDVVNQTIDEVERNKSELRSVVDTAECVSVLKDFVGTETDSADSNDEDNNKYYFWGGKKKVRGEEYTAHVCVKPIMAEGDLSKISRINVFMALRSDDDDMSELSSDSAWYDSITFKEPLNANDVITVLKSNECNYLRECTAGEMQKFDEGLYTYVQSKPENISYPFVDKAEEFKPEYLKQVIEKIGKDIDRTEIKGATSGAYVKLDNEHFITILPAFNNKGTDIIGLKCSYNDSQGNKITSALFSLGIIDKAVGKKSGTAFIKSLEGESIEVDEQKYDIEVISNVENQTDEAIKKSFAELKNVSSFDVKEKVKTAYDALRNVGGFVKASIGQIGKEQNQKDMVNFLADYCTEIIKSIKVEPVKTQDGADKTKAANASTQNPAQPANTGTPTQTQEPAQPANTGNPADNKEQLHDSLKEDELAEKYEPGSIVTVTNRTVKEKTYLSVYPKKQDTLLVNFDVNAVYLELKKPVELAVEARFKINNANVDGESKPSGITATVCLPSIGKKDPYLATFNVDANSAENTGKAFAEAIMKIGGEYIKLKPQENPKGEALNDSIRESIKFNVSYEANDKIAESAAYSTGVTRKISSDRDASKYYVISECMWSCANDAVTKKVLVSKLMNAIKKDPTKYGLMEYAKANDNVEFSKNFADMSYGIKKPGNLHSIIGCSLFECAVAVRFNDYDNISNAIAIGVNKIY